MYGKYENMKIKVLHIENDRETYNSIKNNALKFNIDLEYAKSAVEGIQKLKEDTSIIALVLDAKGFENIKSNEESFKSLTKNLEGIKQIETKRKKLLVKCILTGYPGDPRFKDEYKDLMLFDKTDSIDKVFEFIKEEIKKLPRYHSFKDYPLFFEMLQDHYLGPGEANNYQRYTHNMVEWLENKTEDSYSFKTLRDSLEHFLKKICEQGIITEIQVGDRPFFGRSVSLSLFTRYFNGLKITDRNSGQDIFAKREAPCGELVAKSFQFQNELQKYDHNPEERFPLSLWKAGFFAYEELLTWYKKERDIQLATERDN